MNNPPNPSTEMPTEAIMVEPTETQRIIAAELIEQGFAHEDAWASTFGITDALERARPSPSTVVSDLVGRLKDWALDKAATHHRLAHENEHLRSEHIASSTAYRNLADEIAALSSIKGIDR